MRDNEYKFSSSFLKHSKESVEFHSIEKNDKGSYYASKRIDYIRPKRARFRFIKVVEDAENHIQYIFKMWSEESPNRVYDMMFSKEFVISGALIEEVFH